MDLYLDKMEVVLQTFEDDEWYDHVIEWRMSIRE
jgi:hypothetical protein